MTLPPDAELQQTSSPQRSDCEQRVVTMVWFGNARMGGDRKFYYPRYVWSPAGGWWRHSPPNWQRNTALVALGIAALVIPLASASNRLEVRVKGRFW